MTDLSSTALSDTLGTLAAGLDAPVSAHYDRLAALTRRIEQTDSIAVPGSKAPAFSLPSAGGSLQSLAGLIAHRPMLVVFARGVWCPFCQAELTALKAAWPQFQAIGAGIVVITPDLHGGAAALRDSLDLPFEVLCDVDCGVALAYGCLFALPAEDNALLRGRGVDLAERYGGDGAFMLLPACFCVGQDGTIQASFAKPDMRCFPAIQTLLDGFAA